MSQEPKKVAARTVPKPGSAPSTAVRTTSTGPPSTVSKAPVSGGATAVKPAAPTRKMTALQPHDEDSAGAQTKAQMDETMAYTRPADAKPAAKSPAPKPAGGKAATILGDYKLIKKLGQGGMGAVYKAQKVSTGEEVAIKVLSKELAAKTAFVQRFQREARVMAKLKHPNILPCYDFGEALGFHFLTMEVVDGGSVENYLKKFGRFELGDALHIIITAAKAMHHAHDLEMVHRDIKPDNILLTKTGILKVADLGLAKELDEDMSLTKTGAGAGTPIYMAPEQARDVKHVDRRCDIYAFGIMLYVFLTGEPPFKGETLVDLISAKEKGKFAPMRRLNDNVPGKLDLIVDKMLATKVEHRYANLQQVVQELEALGLANERLSFLDAPAAEAATTPASPATKAPGPVANTAAAKTASASKSAVAAKKPAPTKTPANAPAKTQGPAKAATKGPAAKSTGLKKPVEKYEPVVIEDDDEGEVWYWNISGPSGKTVTKKMTVEQLKTLIKSGSIEPSAPISKTTSGGFRAIGTYPDFQPYFKGRKSSEKVKGQTQKNAFQLLAEEEARRRKWKWLWTLMGSLGRGVMGLVWIALVLAAIAAGYYFLREPLGLPWPF